MLQALRRRPSARLVTPFPERAFYVHVPKTGGTYLGQVEGSRRPVVDELRYGGHTYVVDDPDVLNPIYLRHCDRDARRAVTPRARIAHMKVVSCVRNVFDWLVSYYWHCGGLNRAYDDPDHYDRRRAERGFEYLVKSIADRDGLWPSRRLVFLQLFVSSGSFICDRVFRTESLNADLETFARDAGLRFQPTARQRVSRSDDYRRYYDDALAELVATTWAREIRLFGFAFDGEATEPPLVPVAPDPSLEQRLRYDAVQDVLTLDGVELAAP